MMPTRQRALIRGVGQRALDDRPFRYVAALRCLIECANDGRQERSSDLTGEIATGIEQVEVSLLACGFGCQASGRSYLADRYYVRGALDHRDRSCLAWHEGFRALVPCCRQKL